MKDNIYIRKRKILDVSKDDTDETKETLKKHIINKSIPNIYGKNSQKMLEL